MKRFGLLCFLLIATLLPGLTGCGQSKPHALWDHLEPVEQVGEVPAELREVVAKNEFDGIVAFEDRLLKAEELAHDEENRTITYRVKMMDLCGKELAAYELVSDDACNAKLLTATEDGGFLFALGFYDYAYSYNPLVRAGDNGYASRIIKCDKNGNLQFDIALDYVEGSGLQDCFEKDGKFYIFGDVKACKERAPGYSSQTDIYMLVLDEKGGIINSKTLEGSDFDALRYAEPYGDGFLLSVSSQSRDGDFGDCGIENPGVEWLMIINDDLEITEKLVGEGRDVTDRRVGERSGEPIYDSDPLFEKFDGGGITSYIDYGDWCLIVSVNLSGVYENMPKWSCYYWFYQETVYSGYNNQGELLFRASADASPDFEEMIRDYEEWANIQAQIESDQYSETLP